MAALLVDGRDTAVAIHSVDTTTLPLGQPTDWDTYIGGVIGTWSAAEQTMENVLRNLTVRADHESGWMREEADAIEAFAAEVLAAEVVEEVPDAGELRSALGAYRSQRNSSWFTADVQAVPAFLELLRRRIAWAARKEAPVAV